MGEYEVRKSRIAYTGHLSRIRVDEVLMPEGDLAEREIVEHPDAVAVVALSEAQEVILLRQYRHAVRSYQLEIPAGKLDVDEEPAAAAAARELREETGRQALDLEFLIRYHNSSGWTDESTTVYLARSAAFVGLPDGFQARHEEAEMELVLVPFPDAVRMAECGEITDAKTVIGILLARAALALSQDGR